MDVQFELERLLRETGASRVTLRQETAGDVFPVTHEALAAGVPSIVGVRTPNMAGQPVVVLALAGQQVVQQDCEAAFPGDAPFHEMLGLYGGMRAQVVTPVRAGGRTVAVVSLHELRAPRSWTAAEIAACVGAASSVGELLAAAAG